MDERVRRLEAEVSDLSQRVQRLETALRLSHAPAAVAGAPPAVAAASSAARDGSPALPQLLTYSGRTFLVLGGAFLVRALTEQGVLAPSAGVAAGLAFALAWIGAAQWAVARGNRLSAGFHGYAAALVAYPLVWETTTRLAAVSPRGAAAVVALFTTLLLAVAWRGNLRVLAWGAIAAALGTASALVRASDGGVALPLVLIGLCAAAWWLGESRGWTGLRWPVALLLDFVALRGIVLATRAHEIKGDPALALAIGAAVALLAVAALTWRTIVRELPVRPFDGVQAVLGLAVAATGAVLAAAPLDVSTAWAGGAAVILAVGAIFVALRVVPRHRERGADFAFYSSAGVALLFVGGALIANEPLRSPLWAAFAVVAALLGRRMQATPLWTNAAALGWGAALASGLATAAWSGFSGAADRPWPPFTASMFTVLALTSLAWVLTSSRPAPDRREVPSWMPRIPAGALLLLDVLALCALALHAEHAAFGARATPAVLAASRMVALVAAAFALAAVRQRVLRVELAWVAYALLALGAVKLPAQDLRDGNALALLVSFGTYGAALILVPRLARGARVRPEAPAAPAIPPGPDVDSEAIAQPHAPGR